MKKLIILVGLPYSGKSTYIKKHNNGGTIISSDYYLEMYAKDNNVSYSVAFNEYIKTATKLSQGDFNAAIRDDVELIFIDKTNMTIKSRANWIKPAKEAGYDIEAVIFKDVSKDELIKRKAQRPDKIISDVVINSMKQYYQKPTTSEGIDKITYA